MADKLKEFPTEEIPDQDLLYLRVHRAHVQNGEMTFAALRDQEKEGHPPGMSVNWCRYATAQRTRCQGSQAPDKYGVVKMVVGAVRAIRGLSVEHVPCPDNRAHSEIYGNKKDQEVRMLLTRACEWVIRIAA